MFDILSLVLFVMPNNLLGGGNNSGFGGNLRTHDLASYHKDLDLTIASSHLFWLSTMHSLVDLSS